jgi:hypothetical protein
VNKYFQKLLKDYLFTIFADIYLKYKFISYYSQCYLFPLYLGDVLVSHILELLLNLSHTIKFDICKIFPTSACIFQELAELLLN